jgi:hypothetical protein
MSTPITLPVNFVDGQGFTWQINEDGSVASLLDSSFDLNEISGLDLEFPNSGSGDTFSEDSGREIVIGPCRIMYSSSYSGEASYLPLLTRKIFVSPTQGWIRFLEILTNDSPQELVSNLPVSSYLGSGSKIIQTSSGDDRVDTADRWLISDDSLDPGDVDAPPLLHVLSGPGGYRPTSANHYSYSGLYENYQVTLKPGETKVVMHFVAFNTDAAAAAVKGDALKLLGLDALQGMSLEEKSHVINFDLGVNSAMLPPDLFVSSAGILGGVNKVNIGSNANVSLTVQNIGQNSIQSGSGGITVADEIFFSTDNQLDDSDVPLSYGGRYITPGNTLAPGQGYTDTRQITISDERPIGQQYLIVRTDTYDSVMERDETNNVRVIPIEITAPDLVINPINPVSTISVAEKTTLSWTVTNQGTGSTYKDFWYDSVYLSEDAVLDTADIRLINQEVRNPLFNPNSTTDVIQGPEFKAEGVKRLGQHYLIYQTNNGGQSAQKEISTVNNTTAVAVQVKAPDLAVLNLTAPTEAVSGRTIEVSWLVKNSGNATAETWSDTLYLYSEPTVRFASSGTLVVVGS